MNTFSERMDTATNNSSIANKVKLDIEGMTCVNCALGLSKYLEKRGASDVNVSFADASATFQIEQETQLPELVEGIHKLGFKVLDEEDETNNVNAPKTFELGLLGKVIFCALFTLPLLLAMFLPYPILKNPLFQLLISLPVMIVGWWHFGRSAWASLKTGVPNMDVLIFIGSTAAFLYSLIGFTLSLGPNYLFFETAATIITLVLLGNYIEYRSVKQTTSAIRELTALQPEKAKRLIDKNGLETVVEVPIKDIKKDQIFIVNEGDKIPTDGKIVWGTAAIDEALMTGESIPLEKGIKDQVIGGTIVQNGSIKIQAERVGEDTALAQIIQLVKEAQDNKPPIQRFADTISAFFVPMVLGIAALTFLLGYYSFDVPFQKALLNGIAVLVVSCPCAMGLATPTAVMVGVGRAAQNGILFKGADVMERLKKIKNIVFDKTGTLTTGDFYIKESETSLDRNHFRSVLMSLEKHSSHPLARSIVQKLEEYPDVKPFHFEEVREVKGLGIIGKDGQGNTYTAGSYKLVSELTKDDSHNIYLMRNNELVGWIDMQDDVRPNAKSSVQNLKDLNIQPYLLSGDKINKTIPMAKEVGIQNYYAEKLPQEKIQFVSELSKQGTTAMVGDGINDAPALAKADVGISLSDATQIAMQSSDIVLLNGDLSRLPTAVKISKKTVQTIRQNLFWAFFYNILMIPFAATGLLSPMLAAFAMAFSDIIVIGNSIRLKYRNID